ncbi:hypothetical protein [Ornithinimicrobium kibberense]
MRSDRPRVILTTVATSAPGDQTGRDGDARGRAVDALKRMAQAAHDAVNN